jgi:hypothetical protein
MTSFLNCCQYVDRNSPANSLSPKKHPMPIKSWDQDWDNSIDFYAPSQISIANSNPRSHESFPKWIGRSLIEVLHWISATYLRITFCAGCWAISVVSWMRRRTSWIWKRRGYERTMDQSRYRRGCRTSIMLLEVIQEMKDCRYEPGDCRKLLGCLG